ncbi:hypothetical protein LINPERHAP2_LOCUS2887 [Linum perenne]
MERDNSQGKAEMNVNAAYHVGGKFEGSGTNFGYVGGHVVIIDDVDPDLITRFNLEVRLKSQVQDIDEVNLYYKKPSEEGFDAYRVIIQDFPIAYLLQAYRGRDVYDMFVEEVDGAIGGSRVVAHLDSDESDEEYVDHGIPSESDDSDFEVGSWISEEDREEVEEIWTKVPNAKEKLKKGVSFLCNHNGDAYESDGEESHEVGYYEEVDLDDEVRYRKSPYPKKHAIVERRNLRWVKNDPTGARLTCKWKGCDWLFFASTNNIFKLVHLKNHKKHVCLEHYKNKFVTPTVIATHYKDRIKPNPRWKNRHMRQMVREDFGCEVMVM